MVSYLYASFMLSFILLRVFYEDFHLDGLKHMAFGRLQYAQLWKPNHTPPIGMTFTFKGGQLIFCVHHPKFLSILTQEQLPFQD